MNQKRVDIVNELHRPLKKRFPRRKTIMKGIDDCWQLDLIFLIRDSSQNYRHKYILSVIDTFSKYAFARPLKSKNAKEVAETLEDIFNKEKRRPKLIQSDAGGEFFNATFKRLMLKYNIIHYSTFSHMKVKSALQ